MCVPIPNIYLYNFGFFVNFISNDQSCLTRKNVNITKHINEKLENIKTNIGKQYQRLCDRDSYVTAEKVRNAFLGMGDDCRLLLQTFDEYRVKDIPFKELKRDFTEKRSRTLH